MNTTKSFLHYFNCSVVALVTLLLAGCGAAPDKVATTASPAMAAAPTTTALPTIRIKAGTTDGIKDSHGHTWLPDQGFSEGDVTDRPGIKIDGTDDQEIYQSERYSMTKFSQALPNGKYTVKLHFCETYDGITGPGQRVFSFNVAGHEFKDFDVWAKAGGMQKAYIETVPVDITNGKLEITFTANVENPQINGIEIIPAN